MLIDFGENGFRITAAKKYVPAVVLDLAISMGSTREGGFQKGFCLSQKTQPRYLITRYDGFILNETFSLIRMLRHSFQIHSRKCKNTCQLIGGPRRDTNPEQTDYEAVWGHQQGETK